MSWTQADLDALDEELKTRGTLTGITSADGDSASFESLKDVLEFRARIAAEIGAASSPPKHVRFAVTSKGF
jgi:hypothetical protein